MSLPAFLPVGLRGAAVRQLPLRAAALVGLVLFAYNYSLLTLARGLTLQTPLAYLALVPIMAIGLAVARLRIEPKGLPIHDRQLDWIVGLGLLGTAAAVLIFVPNPSSSTFWLQRIDLLTLPLFVAGLIALLFGVRRLWSLKGPIAFLLLAWPVPYTLFLSGVAGQFTELTAHLVAAITKIIPVATAGATDDTLFLVGSGVRAFSVSVGSACSGVNSFVGFLLIGSALLYIVRGPVIRRLIWLALGLALVFGLNVLRIVVILVVGANFGQAAALDVLHPIAGLIVFNIGVFAMVALVPRFGLWFVGPRDRPEVGGSNTPSHVSRVRPAMIVAVCVACILAVTNAAYARFDAISAGLGDARLGAFDVNSLNLAGWHSRFLTQFAQAKQYFGESATWDRALYWPTPEASLSSTRSIFVDVLTTDDPGSLAAYGVEACYRFHGYTIKSITTADVGAGVTAQIIDWVNPKVKADWSALWWEWPYTDGGKTRYERVMILMGEGPDAQFTGVTAKDVATQDTRFAESDRFLVTLGRTIVQSQLTTATR